MIKITYNGQEPPRLCYKHGTLLNNSVCEICREEKINKVLKKSLSSYLGKFLSKIFKYSQSEIKRSLII